MLSKEIQDAQLKLNFKEQQLFIGNRNVLGAVYFYLLYLAAFHLGHEDGLIVLTTQATVNKICLFFNLLMCQEGAREFVKSWIDLV